MSRPLSLPTAASFVAALILQPRLLSSRLALSLAWVAFLPGAQATDLGSVVAGNNTADGSGVLVSRTTGISNTGIGFQALNHDNTGSNNTACGFEALLNNTSGSNNTATGLNALQKNSTGINNTANGSVALFSNNTGQSPRPVSERFGAIPAATRTRLWVLMHSSATRALT